MKEYFSHDYGSRRDPKLIKLRIKMGHDGIGIYWCLVEYLYEQSGYLMLSQCECIADELHTDCDKLKMIINDFDLFEKDGEKFWSESALERLSKREMKSKSASNAAKKRWSDAKAMRSHSNSSAKLCKEKKRKEKKRKEDIEFVCPEHLSKVFPKFEIMRKGIKKPLSEYAKVLIVEKLNKLSSDNQDQVEILKNSIENSWQGVFALKNNSNSLSGQQQRVSGAEEIYDKLN